MQGKNVSAGVTKNSCQLGAKAFTTEPKCEDAPPPGPDSDPAPELVTPGLPPIDLFLNRAKRANLLLMEEAMRQQTQSSFPLDQIGKNFTSLFNLLWNSNLPCYKRPGRCMVWWWDRFDWSAARQLSTDFKCLQTKVVNTKSKHGKQIQ